MIEQEITMDDVIQLLGEQVHELSQLTELVLELKSQNERLLKGLTLCYKLLEERPAVPTMAAAADEIITEPVAGQLCVNKLEGKYYFSVKVPKWMKHGVRVWPEVLESVGINPDGRQLDYEPIDMTGWMCQYILGENGNPKKAIALTRPH